MGFFRIVFMTAVLIFSGPAQAAFPTCKEATNQLLGRYQFPEIGKVEKSGVTWDRKDETFDPPSLGQWNKDESLEFTTEDWTGIKDISKTFANWRITIVEKGDQVSNRFGKLETPPNSDYSYHEITYLFSPTVKDGKVLCPLSHINDEFRTEENARKRIRGNMIEIVPNDVGYVYFVLDPSYCDEILKADAEEKARKNARGLNKAWKETQAFFTKNRPRGLSLHVGLCNDVKNWGIRK